MTGRQHAVDCLGDLDVLQQQCPLGPQPMLEHSDPRYRPRFTRRKAGRLGVAGDLALDVEEGTCRSAHHLFHLLSKLYERISVVITTNLSFREWALIFGEAKMTKVNSPMFRGRFLR